MTVADPLTNTELGKALNHAIVQYDLACRCERDDEGYWLAEITKRRDAIRNLTKEQQS